MRAIDYLCPTPYPESMKNLFTKTAKESGAFISIFWSWSASAANRVQKLGEKISRINCADATKKVHVHNFVTLQALLS
jgi:hypothetical protein